jgi:hypothetical protein
MTTPVLQIVDHTRINQLIRMVGTHRKDEKLPYRSQDRFLNVAQDRDRWRALVNTVMNLRVS